MDTIIAAVIGRGHSGTRGIAGWLRGAGFFIGPKGQVNGVNDYQTRGAYHAARIAGQHVDRIGDHQWSFERLLRGPIPDSWRNHVESYLKPIYAEGARTGRAAWKLPECVFWMPWLCRAYPEVKLVVVHRDPRDLLLKGHGTDDLAHWGVPVDRGGVVWSGIQKKVESWKLQTDLILATTAAFPERVVAFRLFDYVHDHETVRAQVSAHLGVEMQQGETKTGPVGRHKQDHRSEGTLYVGRRLEWYCRHFDGADPGPFRHVPGAVARLAEQG